MTNSQPLLSVKNLSKIYGTPSEKTIELTGPKFNSNQCPETESIVACTNVSFDLHEGEILGIVGESGSGKSTIVKLLFGDIEATSGECYFSSYKEGTKNTLTLPPPEKRYLKNYLFGMVYQNPHLGLNFSYSAGGNIAEKLIMADNFNVESIRNRSIEILEKTEISSKRLDHYLEEFSGGMQQRVQIAKAIANNPPLLFLDEVTTGLDVSVQAKVLDLIRTLQQQLKVTMIVVSHDLAVIRMLTDRTLVMKNGHIVEQGLTDQILQDPQHPYTQLLVSSLL